jgi:hypothetical protein
MRVCNHVQDIINYTFINQVCADINIKLGFKQPAAAWSVLRGLRRNTDHKTHIELITLNA